jgi:hypothetical protein
LTEPPLNIAVYFSHIAGDRYWSFEKAPPPNIHINVNVNLLDLERSGNSLKAPFIASPQGNLHHLWVGGVEA